MDETGQARTATGPGAAPATDLDLLVVGSGVAGLTAALRARSVEPGLRVGLISKHRLADSATGWAQGGLAAVLGSDEAAADGSDTPERHALDTIRAACGLADHEAVDVLVREGPQRLRDLADLGAFFDRDRAGRWLLSREAGHSAPRVVHAGGAATGAEVERALIEVVRATLDTVVEECSALDLIIDGGRCVGVDTSRGPIRSRHTVVATGGSGQLYPVTTNPPEATADGLAMAIRAGAAVADLEFVQFHPTALNIDGWEGPRLLLSEALRGEGALLRDDRGERFVDELLPRDVVAAAIAARGGAWLDLTPVEDFETRFPTLAQAVRAAGLDPAGDRLPVAPAAHYHCGGIMTDLTGATTLPGLWAAGEVACTGVHGANRLASNSLVEGLVMATRAVHALAAGRDGPQPTGVLRALLEPETPYPGSVPVRCMAAPRGPLIRPGAGEPGGVLGALRECMSSGAGVERSAASLDAAGSQLERLANTGVPAGEAANLLTVARALVAAAVARTESRGGHRRRDYPSTDANLSLRFVQWQ
ncbi:MAG: FAD-dependent oxidoreductase [Acidobacteriota bacterium]|nr:FAD-dependent oxidoreductase [Acidobacteriota bacterium]